MWNTETFRQELEIFTMDKQYIRCRGQFGTITIFWFKEKTRKFDRCLEKEKKQTTKKTTTP